MIKEAEQERQGGGSSTSGSILSSKALVVIPDGCSSFLDRCLSSSLSSGAQLGINQGSSTEQNNQACFDEVSRNLLGGSAFWFSKVQLLIHYPHGFRHIASISIIVAREQSGLARTG